MNPKFSPRKLAVLNFAKTEAGLESTLQLAQFERLHEFQQSGGEFVQVHYQARGEMRAAGAGKPAPWLRLTANTRLTLVCQRCLAPVEEEVSFDREFRFVESEEQAQIEDEDAEEDVLALSADFDLMDLLEDELLMALPASPKHAVCPQPVKLRVADLDSDEPRDKPSPFAALARLKTSGD